MLKVLIVHNRYTQPGGEDEVVAAETAMLRRHGHEVVEYTEDNRRARSMSRLRLAARTIWSTESRRAIAGIVRSERPDVAHFHNTFPLISPSGYYACREAGIPVVQTVHNYRIVCSNAMLLRDGRPCVKCVGRSIPWPGVRYGCYHHSVAQSAVIATMIGTHHWIGTWTEVVDIYITLTKFASATLVLAGISPSKIRVKPNFYFPDHGPGTPQEGRALFVGRLTEDKGLRVLLSAWTRLAGRWPLTIIGDGPLRDDVIAATQRIPNVEWLGWREQDEVLACMQQSSLLVIPSLAYEGFPRIIPEAFSVGLPVLVTGHGGLPEIVEDGVSGTFSKPGDEIDLALRVESTLRNPSLLAKLRTGARRAFESRYSEQPNYDALLKIYAASASQQAGAAK
jgi:glycosyltransferase involved in cell wall biosynthesis